MNRKNREILVNNIMFAVYWYLSHYLIMASHITQGTLNKNMRVYPRYRSQQLLFQYNKRFSHLTAQVMIKISYRMEYINKHS
jgi:hypothetical protein